MQIAKPRTKKFQRNKENFSCENCDTFVVGDGYRNHCPNCLTSKHVDVNPGDRAANCGGLMTVIEIALSHGDLVLTHACQTCQHSKPNKSHPDDSIEAITSIMSALQKAS